MFSRSFAAHMRLFVGTIARCRQTYLDQLVVVPGRVLVFEVVSAVFLVTEEGGHRLFRSILILLDTPLLWLLFILGLDLLDWGN
jgi:hypothetical protein